MTKGKAPATINRVFGAHHLKKARLASELEGEAIGFEPARQMVSGSLREGRLEVGEVEEVEITVAIGVKTLAVV